MIKSSNIVMYRLFISILIGVGFAIYAFTLEWNSFIGNTLEEIEQARKRIAHSFVNDKGEAVEPDWSIIEDIAGKLTAENCKIIKARALLKYESNPITEILVIDNLDWSAFNREFGNDVKWNDRNDISQHNLIVISETTRIAKSAAVAVLSGIGSTLLFLLIMFLIPILWYFILNRLGELSRAIQGK
jgi:hypothetical protein